MPGRSHAIKVNQIRRVARLYRDGHSRREIAAFFDVSDMAIRNALKLAKVPMRNRKAAASVGVKRWAISRRRVSSVFSLAANDQRFRRKPAADGPRYKSHGNSWAVNCPAWIGSRIEQVEAITGERIAA